MEYIIDLFIKEKYFNQEDIDLLTSTIINFLVVDDISVSHSEETNSLDIEIIINSENIENNDKYKEVKIKKLEGILNNLDIENYYIMDGFAHNNSNKNDNTNSNETIITSKASSQVLVNNLNNDVTNNLTRSPRGILELKDRKILKPYLNKSIEKKLQYLAQNNHKIADKLGYKPKIIYNESCYYFTASATKNNNIKVCLFPYFSTLDKTINEICSFELSLNEFNSYKENLTNIISLFDKVEKLNTKVSFKDRSAHGPVNEIPIYLYSINIAKSERNNYDITPNKIIKRYQKFNSNLTIFSKDPKPAKYIKYLEKELTDYCKKEEKIILKIKKNQEQEIILKQEKENKRLKEIKLTKDNNEVLESFLEDAKTEVNSKIETKKIHELIESNPKLEVDDILTYLKANK